MGYESLSTVVVLVIVVIIMAGWLPARTVKGMRKVAEHREDRYSSSLHLVDKDSGTRFSDEHTPPAKGIIMQPDQAREAKYTAEHIAHVRQLRHAAIRRRRVIVIALLAITALVLGISFPLHFSALFALIPAALTAAVLALGARAAAQAREWERKVAARPVKRAGTAKAAQSSSAAVASANHAQEISGTVISAISDSAVAATPDEPPTDVIEQREIRRVLRQAREEQARALADRDVRRGGEPAVEVEVSAAGSDADVQTPASGASGAEEVAPAPVITPLGETASEPTMVEVSDETHELDHVSPSRALDAFDMASSQDLISFSLGAPRNGVDVVDCPPESLEIRSMRQVAKAVPVERPEAASRPAVTDSDDAAAGSAHAESVPVSDTAAFHDAEVRRDVEAPEATSDSLGTGLEAILARRSA